VETKNSLTLFRLIGENPPVLRSSDLLTDDHPDRPYPPLHPRRASIWLRALAFIAVLIVIVIVYTSIQFSITGVVVTDSLTTGLTLLAIVGAYSIVAFIMEGRVWPHEIAPSRLLGLLKGMVLGVVLVVVCLGVLALVGSYSITGFNPGYSPWMDILLLGVVAGITEEILFRGMLYRLLEEGLGTWAAAGISGLVFGLLHVTNPDGTWWGAIAIALEAGILFAAVYILTRSLWWCIGLHMAWNITQGPVFGSIVSGTGAQDSWFLSSWTGPEILTGGQFGLEASIVPVILLGALGVALLVYAWRRGLMVAPIWTRKHRLAPTTPQS